MSHHNYYIYFLMNSAKTGFYTGVTNGLRNCLDQHFSERGERRKPLQEKYFCFHLVYWERHPNVLDAIRKEKEIKGWRREKKVKLIEDFNPEWKFLNGEV
ncbi:GIY-YIG nuclease family protein [Nafulsella turpanensis]|uniref:GIY-YIG nuclease family protein n=1 Tax=Nafulsella turpanensis TaxID=1265690 RepID=UPI000381A7EB|nr:GIY-YIG nuclease family protein [Nafulsella turpanensis]